MTDFKLCTSHPSSIGAKGVGVPCFLKRGDTHTNLASLQVKLSAVSHDLLRHQHVYQSGMAAKTKKQWELEDAFAYQPASIQHKSHEIVWSHVMFIPPSPSPFVCVFHPRLSAAKTTNGACTEHPAKWSPRLMLLRLCILRRPSISRMEGQKDLKGTRGANVQGAT